jgi:hypothetical protein
MDNTQNNSILGSLGQIEVKVTIAADENLTYPLWGLGIAIALLSVVAIVKAVK